MWYKKMMKTVLVLVTAGLLSGTMSCSASDTSRTVTESDLIEALPDPLPAGWKARGDLDTGFSLASSTSGVCGGSNQVQRAVDAGALAMVSYPWFAKSDLVLERWYVVNAYAFPSSQAARSYVELTRNAIEECPTYQFLSPESSVDGFMDEDFPDAEWLTTSWLEVEETNAPEADAAVLVSIDNSYEFEGDGTTYSIDELVFLRFAAYGTIVFVTNLSQQHSFTGYADSEESSSETIISAQDLDPVDPLIAGLRQNLLG